MRKKLLTILKNKHIRKVTYIIIIVGSLLFIIISSIKIMIDSYHKLHSSPTQTNIIEPNK